MEDRKNFESILIRDINIKNITNLLAQNKFEQILFNIPNLKKLELTEFTKEVLMITLLNNFDSITSINKFVNFLEEEKNEHNLFFLQFLNEKYPHLIKNSGKYIHSIINISKKITENNIIIDEKNIILLKEIINKDTHLRKYLNSSLEEILKMNTENIKKNDENKEVQKNTKRFTI